MKKYCIFSAMFFALLLLLHHWRFKRDSPQSAQMRLLVLGVCFSYHSPHRRDRSLTCQQWTCLTWQQWPCLIWQQWTCLIWQQWTCLIWQQWTCLICQQWTCPRNTKNHSLMHKSGPHGSVQAHTRSDSIPRVPGSLCKPSRTPGSPYSTKTDPNYPNPKNAGIIRMLLGVRRWPAAGVFN